MNLSPEIERLVTVRIIQEDTEVIYSLIKSERDSVFAMGILPYFSLYIKSLQEYVGQVGVSGSEEIRIKNIRNNIKDYADGFGKVKKKVDKTDQTHDEEFKSQLRFEFLKNRNIHYNLGTYWTDDGIIIGNTQQIASSLEVDSFFDPSAEKREFNLGYQIGRVIGSVRTGLSEHFTPPEIKRSTAKFEIRKFCDFNTNKKIDMFVDNSQKNLNLYYLHLLCNMNFVKHILRKKFINTNSWIFRVEYIVTYYTYRALIRLKNYCDNNKDVEVDIKDIESLIDDGNKIFQTKFRNCMMHYDLVNQNVLSIENIDKPFYGIIETCFDGMSFDEYLKLLHNISDSIIGCLEKRFDFTKVKLKNL